MMSPINLPEGERPSDPLILEFMSTPIQRCNRRELHKVLQLAEAKGPLHDTVTYTVRLEEHKIFVVFASKENTRPVTVWFEWFGDMFARVGIRIGKQLQENLKFEDVERILVSHFK
jgi:hypothetical protein